MEASDSCKIQIKIILPLTDNSELSADSIRNTEANTFALEKTNTTF
jgi:hypothetical protein